RYGLVFGGGGEGSGSGTLAAVGTPGGTVQAPKEVADPTDPRVKNVRWFKWLLTQIPTVLTPTFQGIVRLVTARRISDAGNRKVAMKIIEDVATMLKDHLTWARGAEGTTLETYNYLVIVLGVLSVMTIEDRNLQLQTWIAVSFVKSSGLDTIFSIANRLWSDAEALNTEELLAQEGNREKLARIHSGVNICLTILGSLVQSRVLHESPHTAGVMAREKDKKSPEYWDAWEWLVDMRGRVGTFVRDLWGSEYLKKCPTDVVQGVVLLVVHILKGEGETRSAQPERAGPSGIGAGAGGLGGLASLFGRHIGGAPPVPDEGKIQQLCDMGFPRAAAETALIRCGNNVARAAEYLLSHPDVVAAAQFSAAADAAAAGAPAVAGSSGAGGNAEAAAAAPAAADAGPSAGETVAAEGADEGDDDMDEDDLATALAMSMGTPPEILPGAFPNTTGAGDAMDADPPAAAPPQPATETPVDPALQDKGKGKELDARQQLEALRQELKADLISRSIALLDHVEAVVFEIKELLSQVFKDNLEVAATAIVAEIEKEREAAIASGVHDSKRLAIRLRLYALFVSDEGLQKKVVMASPQFVTGLIEMTGADGTCTPWLSHVLLIVEAYLSFVDEPKSVDLKAEELAVGQERPQAKVELEVSLEERKKLVERVFSLLRLETLEKDLVHAVMRLAVRLTRMHSIAVEFAKLEGVPLLFNEKRIGSFAAFQGMVVMILRHVIEDANVLRQTMEREVAGWVGSQRPSRFVDVHGLLKGNGHVAVRDPEAFLEATAGVVQLPRYVQGSLASAGVALKKKEGEKDGKKNGAEGGEVAGGVQPMEVVDVVVPAAGPGPIEEVGSVFNAPPQFQSQYLADVSEGVVHFLVMEILDLKGQGGEKVQSPAVTGEASTAAGGSSSAAPAADAVEADVENIRHIRRCFLLQCLAELIVSYPSCKVDVMNASQKRGGKNTPHKISVGRNAFLAHLLNDLLPHGFDTTNPTAVLPPPSLEKQKKSAESTWATSVLSGLCVGVTTDLAEEKEKYPDLVNIRKTVLDAVARSLKDAIAHGEGGTEAKYSRFLAVSDLCHKILTARNPGVVAASSRSGAEDIPIHVAKVMLEKGFVNIFTQMLGEVDVHHPDSRTLLNAILKPLEFLTKAAIKMGRAAEIGGKKKKKSLLEIVAGSRAAGEDAEVVEGVPDMYRNSALGVFENRGSDEDMDETDSENDEGSFDEEFSGDENDEDEDMDEGSDVEDDMEIVVSQPYHGAHDMDITDEDQESDSESDDDEVIEEGEEGDEGDEMSWEDDDGYEDVEDDDDDEGEGVEVIEEGGGEFVLGDEVHADHEDEEGGEHEHLEDEHVHDEGEPDEGDHDDDEGDQDDDMSDEDDESDDSEADVQALDRQFGFVEGEEDEVYMPIGRHSRMGLPRHPLGLGLPVGGRGLRHRHRGRGRTFMDMLPGEVDIHWIVEDEMGMPYEGGPGMHFLSRMGGRGGPSRGNPPPVTDDAMAHPLLVHRQSAAAPHSHRLDITGQGLPPLGLPADLGNAMDDFMQGDPLSFLEQLFSRGLGGGRGGLPPMLAAGGVDPIITPLPGGSGFTATFGQPPPHAGGAAGDVAAGTAAQSGTGTEDQLSILHSFTPLSTADRWVQEARLMYGSTVNEKALRVENALLNVLVPVAMEEEKKRKAKEDEERKVREEEEKKKAEEEERKRKEEEETKRVEGEEKKKKEEEEAAAKAAVQAADTDVAMEDASASQPAPMETDEPAVSAPVAPAEPAPEPERQVILINGVEVDITGTGIDITFLQELPDEFRQEVINQHRREQQQSRPQPPTEVPASVNSEFLDALPPEIREEVLAAERAEENRRQRAAQRPAAPAPVPLDLDPASFLATLDPNLRQNILVEQDDNFLASLPPALVAEANALRSNLRRNYGARMRSHVGDPRLPPAAQPTAAKKAPHREAVQLIDRQELMTLLRLLFVPEPVSKPLLHRLLVNVAENTKTRNDLVALLLSILADGSTDLSMVDKSFSQLSLNRKSSKSSLKTPSRQTPGGPGAGSSGLSGGAISVNDTVPNLVATRCLETLREVVTFNEQMAVYFLTENDNLVIGGKGARTPGSARKGKGKEKATLGHVKYPVAVLLSLLDRPTFLENSTLMEQLMQLLMMITKPLSAIGKKKEAEGKAAKEAKEGQPAEGAGETSAAPAVQAEAQQPPAIGEMPVAPSQPEGIQYAGEVPATPAPAAEPKPTETKPAEPELKPPSIPEEHIRGVVNVLTGGAVSSKTFQYTLSVIQQLSILAGNSEIISHELMESAQRLGDAMIPDLDDLVHVLTQANTAVEVQTDTLQKFSPPTALQAKLLRVLKTIDFLHSKKGAANLAAGNEAPALADGPVGRALARLGVGVAGEPAAPASGLTSGISTPGETEQRDTLTHIYNNLQYAKLWQRLGSVLATINDKEEELIHVATVMLPLIESFMVVSKPYVLIKTPAAAVAAQAAPPALARASTKLMQELYAKHNDELFIAFTEEHRKILNTMVRNTPSLMNGSFSLLVQNSKVLEFDNKRTFFNQQIHKRGQRDLYGSLSVNVRRQYVFEDSYHQLQARSGDEIKYGKLNVRFYEEEGVDAGGVTREWYSELAKQIFNPNYALFRESAIDKVTYQPNRLSSVNPEHLSYFKFVGRIIGKAIYDGRLLDCYFTRSFYKAIIEAPVDYKDMEAVDPDFHKSLDWMLNNEIADVFDLTFTVEVDEFGVKKVLDLKPDGSKIAVTDQNKFEYVKLIVEHKLVTAIKEQIQAFLSGFYEIIPKELVKIFNEQELELLISGMPDIDIDDWRNNTEYQNYTGSSPQVQWFWRAVRSFSQEERAKLIQFATGTSKVPLEGFKALQGVNGGQKFQIHKDFARADRLPSAHTW
ncbi:hypothetical protein HK097_010180, partial [Rhizophlyctis rosea]